MKPKLLVTSSSFAHIQNFHLPYLKGFREQGWEIHAACGNKRKEIPFADQVVQLPLKKSVIAPQNLAATAALRKLMQENRYDLVITHTSLAAFFTRLAMMTIPGRPRCINVVHGYLFDEMGSPLRSLLYKTAEHIVSGATDQILTMNQYDYAWARKSFPHKTVEYIPGMGASEIRIRKAKRYDYGFAEGSVVLIFSADFSARKNQAMLIRAMPLLPEHVKLVLPGDGELFEACKALARQLGVEKRVVFPGYVRQLIPLLKGADIAVSSSRFEGLPFNLIEAMQCGLPIVASRVKGNCDLVEEGVNGLLYDYDDVGAYVQAVTELVKEEESRRAMGEAGLANAPQYGLGVVYPQVMAAYLGERIPIEEAGLFEEKKEA